LAAVKQNTLYLVSRDAKDLQIVILGVEAKQFIPDSTAHQQCAATGSANSFGDGEDDRGNGHDEAKYDTSGARKSRPK